MRFVAALLLWLITTALLAVAVPTAWAQRNLVDANGFAALAQQSAGDPALQAAVAAELTTQAMRLARERGYLADSARLQAVATAYTAGPSFPVQFARAGRMAHRWLFGDPGGDPWVIDLAPMLNDDAFRELLNSSDVRLPAAVPVPVAASGSLRAGQLRPLATWGPWVSAVVAVLTGFSALLTLLAARRRGKALTCLGVSVLLVGAAGWAGIEVARRYLDEALNDTVADIRRVADVMVGSAVGSLHHWLDVTLTAGAAAVLVGVVVAMLGALRRA